MKIAVSGKGGSGKTTLSGNLARAFAQRGRRVLGIDADPNPNLAATLGLGQAGRPRYLAESLVRETLNSAGAKVERLTIRPDALLQQYGTQAPDGVQLLTIGTVEHAGTGCNCSFHSVVRGLFGELNDEPGWVSITDMEAGLEHLKRGTVRDVDALLVILEPYFRSLETGARVRELAAELGVPRIFAVGNKARNESDAAALTDYCKRHGLELISVIPYDETFLDADQKGISAMDVKPESPGVKAIRALAQKLEARLSA